MVKEYPEPTIIDTTVIQVQSTAGDDYNNLIVTPTEGEDIRIGSKRSNLFPIFQVGRAVKLEWAEFKGKKYVAKAELFDGKPPVERRVEPVTAGVEKPVPIVGRDIGKNRSYALSYAKDIGVAIIGQGKEFSSNRIIDLARAFESYLDGEPPLVKEAKKLGAKNIEPEDLPF